MIIDERERIAENLLSVDDVLRIGGKVISAEDLDPTGKVTRKSESVKVSDLAERVAKEVLEGMDIEHRMMESGAKGGGSSTGSPSSEGEHTTRPPDGRKRESPLSDFVWDVARVMMESVAKGRKKESKG
ncbi:hypothetical protein [Methanopyrus sp.]